MSAPPLLMRAHGKLNLGLWVTARRDDGFHEIETLFARLELHDELSVAPAATVRGELTAGDGVRLGGLSMDDGNLVVRAVHAYRRAADEQRGLRLDLLKRIPIAAGLGGGSSDAAQALLAVARLYPAAVDLQALALELGSDLPFFLSDQAAAWAGGRGEALEAAKLAPLPVVLLNPGVEVSASEAYGLVARYDPAPARDALVERLVGSQEPGYRNTLQAGVVEEYPAVGEALAALEETGLRGVLMSGSGATCFGLAASREEAGLVAGELRRRYPDWWVWAGWAAV